MRHYSVLLALALMLATSAVQANSRYQSMPQQGNNGVNTDVVVDMPPEAWTQSECLHSKRLRSISGPSLIDRRRGGL